MKPIYNAAAPRTSMSLMMNSDLLIKSNALNINLSAALEKALIQQLAKHAREQWIEQNRNAIRSYNEFVEENECFADEYREF